ncbi:hypothetical protein [Prosthecobacter sp.]|uniref:hypothetical protein n=1 Tax=Prosthecobacter sp. TaxID=1965333 RepID=UPI003783DB78
MNSSHVTALGCLQQRGIFFMLIAVLVGFGAAAENQSLGKALTGVDWKKLAKGIPDDSEFQSSVRGIFGSLTPEGQRKVTDAINGLREGRGPTVTGTPVDTLVAKKLAQALAPLVFDPVSKNALTSFETNGSLSELMDSITGGKTSTTATKPSTAARPANAKQAVDLAWIVDKTWVSDSGTKWAFGEKWAGEKAFGNNKSNFTWRVLRSGLVEVSGRDTAQSPPRTWYVQFQSETEASYGTSEKNLTNKMHQP